jgi:hypothetical protein
MSVERNLWNSARPLTDQERAAAVQMGVQKPDSIRIAIVDELPEPSPELKHLAEQLRILTPTTNSLTYSHLIVIKRSAPHQDELVQHGLVHALQIERCGSVQAFLREYFEQCLEFGKENCPMELEVCSRVSQLCLSPNV